MSKLVPMSVSEVNAYALYEASEALRKCAAFSVANPTVPLNKNPYYADTNKTHKRALRSLRRFWICSSCNYVMKPIKNPADVDGKIITECCDSEIYLDVE